MPFKFSENIFPKVAKELENEADHYMEALNADAEFHVLKSIKMRMKTLHKELEESHAHYTLEGFKSQDRPTR